MFLAQSNDLGSPIYLVSGDTLIQLKDTTTVANLRGAGLQQLTLSPQEIDSLVLNLLP